MDARLTDALLREAKNNPNGWVYKIDNGYDTSGDIPPEAIVGAWRVDENGEIIVGFISNENYVPSKDDRC